MNRFSIIALAAVAATVALAASPAHAALGAGEGTPGYAHETMVSTTTASRQVVRADAARAQLDGRFGSGEIAEPAVTTVAAMGADRAQVRAQAAEANRLGLVASGEQALVYTAPQLAALQAAGQQAGRVMVAGQR